MLFLSTEVKDYRAYDSIEYNKDDINKFLMKNNSIYELLPSELPRKFYVDIDIKPTNLNYMKYTYDQIVDNTTKAVLSACEAIEHKIPEINSNDIYVCVTENSNIKQRLHITYPIYFKNQKDIKYFSGVVNLR